MLSKHHIELSLLSTFILFGWLIFQNSVTFLAISAGVFIGCLLPDTDLARSKIDYMDGIAGFFGVITKKILNPLVAIIFEYLLKKPIDQSHRGITHTIYGIATYCLFIEVIGLPILFFLGFFNFILTYSFFVFGLFFGGILHLMEDSCTKMGILPFYPINDNKKYSGDISTFDLNEMRPKYYSVLLLVVSIFLLLFQVYYTYPISIDILISIILFLIVWKIIASFSKISKYP